MGQETAAQAIPTVTATLDDNLYWWECWYCFATDECDIGDVEEIGEQDKTSCYSCKREYLLVLPLANEDIENE